MVIRPNTMLMLIALIIAVSYFSFFIIIPGLEKFHVNKDVSGGNIEWLKTSLEEWGTESFAENYVTTPLKLPLLLENTSSYLYEPVFVEQGLISFYNSSIPTPTFSPWGQRNMLSLNKINVRDGLAWIKLNGTTENNAAGFATDELFYDGRYISIYLGKVLKDSNFQISLSLLVEGSNGQKYNVIFINGRVFAEGWRGNTYYQEMKPFSSKLIDLNDLLSARGSKYHHLAKIGIVVEKQAVIQDFQFNVDLSRTTTNTPAYISGNKPFFVIGNVSRNNYSLLDSKYVFHNLNFIQTITVGYKVSNFTSLISNGWDITSLTHYPSSSGKFSYLLKASRDMPIDSIPIILGKIDIYSSLSNPGSKDLLLLVVMLTGSIFIALQKRILIH